MRILFSHQDNLLDNLNPDSYVDKLVLDVDNSINESEKELDFICDYIDQSIYEADRIIDEVDNFNINTHEESENSINKVLDYLNKTH